MSAFLSLLTEGLRIVVAIFLFLATPVTALVGLFRPTPEAKPLKLGAYYWDGWYEPLDQWTDRLLNEFADREPEWGWLSAGVENMEMQIDLAADHGLEFFSFCWYYPEHGWLNPMNLAADRFMAAGNNDRMEFCLLVANHSGALIYADTWHDAVERFMPYLTSERALKVDGKPVIIFFSAGELKKGLGGEKQTREALDYLRAECVKAGLAGCYVIGCTGSERNRGGDITSFFFDWKVSDQNNRALGFDALSGYNYHRQTQPSGEYEYPFRQLSADYELTWRMMARHSRLPYMPVLNGGWDCRPWEVGDNPSRSCYSPDRTPEDFYNHVLAAAQWTKKNPGTSAGGLAIYYAWNEMGEGGYLLPTVGEGDAALKAIAAALETARACP